MTIQQPVPDYAAARQAMVDSQLRPEGVNDPLVVQAMAGVAREQFVPEENRALAYLDRSVPVGKDRSLAPPVATGLLLTAMALRPGERALVVGAATGYSAAVLAAMGLEVTAMDGADASGGPYDAILIEGAVEEVPETIIDQLKDGGRIGYSALDRGISRLTVGRKSGGALGLRTIADSIVASLAGSRRPRAFTF